MIWDREIRHALQAAVRAAVAFATGGHSIVVLVDCFGRDSAGLASRSIEEAGVPVSVVSLWAEPGVLRRRMAQRTDDYADMEMALLLNEEVRTRRVNDTLIDTTHLAPDAVADRIGGVVQWGCCR